MKKSKLRVLAEVKQESGRIGAIAQLGEHLLCKQGVVGSIPTGSSKMEKLGGKRDEFIR